MTALCSQICENKNSYGYCKTTCCIKPLARMGSLDYQYGFTQGYAKAIAEAEPKHGRWIEEDDAIIHGHCSSCGWASVWQETDVFGMNYCPNCGADMREVEE